MATAQERFQAAVNVIKGLPKNGPYQPSNTMMLKFYGLYKQATEGPCHQRKPAFWDVVNKAKWEAWNRNSHLTREEAMNKYVQCLQEIIETMSFTENVQNFVGSLQGLENINLDELEIIAPGMKELAESHPNSPFQSRTNSPQHSTNGQVEDEPTLNGHDSTLDEVATPPSTPVPPNELPAQSSMSVEPSTSLLDYTQTNGSVDQSDDEYVDPFDIQNELYESLQRNNELLKQVQATVLRMNSDLSTVKQRVFDLEKIIKEMKTSLSQRKTSASTSNFKEIKSKYPTWWPFTDISPLWFVLLILWPFIVRRMGHMLASSSTKRK